MASRWIDGFDNYSVVGDLSLRYQSGITGFSTNSGRFGGGAFLLAAGLFTYLGAPLATTPNEIWEGIAISLTANAGTESIVKCWISETQAEFYVTYNATTLIFKLWQFNNSTPIATSSPILMTLHSWHYLDFHFKMASTATGICEVWVDNVRVINAVNIITQVSSTGGNVIVQSVVGRLGSISGESIDGYFDDWCIRDTTGSINNGRIGDSRVCTTYPNADIGPNNGTPSTSGPHYAMVDEHNWSSANTITLANTTGQQETFSFSSLPINPEYVYAVQITAIVEKTDAGTAANKLFINSASNVALGASQNPLDPWGYEASIFEVDPATNAAWIYTAVNALEGGIVVQ